MLEVVLLLPVNCVHEHTFIFYFLKGGDEAILTHH